LRTESQIRDLLDKREALISELSNLLDSESALTSSALKQSNLSRHREVLNDHRKELQRIKANITDTRNRSNLLSNVRSDIDAYRTANPAQAEADYMLHERGRIDDSHRMADGVLSQAYEINEGFTAQRETLASINRRIVGAAAQIPGLNTLMNRIGSKKRRDAIILAVFISICFLMLLYFR
jgi:Golgi SNAP receptor complex protein 1